MGRFRDRHEHSTVPRIDEVVKTSGQRIGREDVVGTPGRKHGRLELEGRRSRPGAGQGVRRPPGPHVDVVIDLRQHVDEAALLAEEVEPRVGHEPGRRTASTSRVGHRQGDRTDGPVHRLLGVAEGVITHDRPEPTTVKGRLEVDVPMLEQDRRGEHRGGRRSGRRGCRSRSKARSRGHGRGRRGSRGGSRGRPRITHVELTVAMQGQRVLRQRHGDVDRSSRGLDEGVGSDLELEVVTATDVTIVRDRQLAVLVGHPVHLTGRVLRVRRVVVAAVDICPVPGVRELDPGDEGLVAVLVRLAGSDVDTPLHRLGRHVLLEVEGWRRILGVGRRQSIQARGRRRRGGFLTKLVGELAGGPPRSSGPCGRHEDRLELGGSRTDHLAPGGTSSVDRHLGQMEPVEEEGHRALGGGVTGVKDEVGELVVGGLVTAGVRLHRECVRSVRLARVRCCEAVLERRRRLVGRASTADLPHQGRGLRGDETSVLTSSGRPVVDDVATGLGEGGDVVRVVARREVGGPVAGVVARQQAIQRVVPGIEGLHPSGPGEPNDIEREGPVTEGVGRNLVVSAESGPNRGVVVTGNVRGGVPASAVVRQGREGRVIGDGEHELLLGAQQGAVATADPVDSAVERDRLHVRLVLEDEMAVLPVRLGGVNVGLGHDNLAVVGSGMTGGCPGEENRSGQGRRQRSEGASGVHQSSFLVSPYRIP